MQGKNYVADYIFATQIAKNAGATDNLPKVMGQGSLCYGRMKYVINTSGIAWTPDVRVEPGDSVEWKSWGSVIYGRTKLMYSEQTAELKEKWRRYFLYGMASHIVADAFSHSCYKKEGGQYLQIKHGSGAHDIINNRFECARNAVYKVAVHCQQKTVGSVMDFSSYGTSYWNGFYLNHILEYALQSDVNNLGRSKLEKTFAPIHCSVK